LLQRSEELIEGEEKKMTTDSRHRGLKRSHTKRKDSKANDIRMSQEEFDREKDEIDFQIRILMEMLHRSDEDQEHHWTTTRRLK